MIDWKVGEMEKANALASMQKCKEFLDPFLKGKENIKSVFDDIKEALKERNDLPIDVFGGAVEVEIEIGQYGHFYYEDKYDIDNDIANIMAIETYDDKIHMSRKEYDEIQHALYMASDFADYLDGIDHDDASYGLGLIYSALDRVVITETEVEA